VQVSRRQRLLAQGPGTDLSTDDLAAAAAMLKEFCERCLLPELRSTLRGSTLASVLPARGSKTG